MRATRLIEWDALEVRVRGERIAPIARALAASQPLPVQLDRIEFRDGEIELAGTVRKGVPIPFRFHVRRIEAAGGIVRVPIEQLSVLGFLPVPSLLFKLAEGMARLEGVTIDAERRTIELAVDRFLPPFLDVEVAAVRPVAGGLLVTLGAGGADLPPGGERWTNGR